MLRRLLGLMLPDRNPQARSLWCKVGLHRWDIPGHPCTECGMRDRLWDE